MKIVLCDNKNLLPKDPGDHIFIYTGLSDPIDGEQAVTVTEIDCTYSAGGQTVVFRKNTEPQTLRFEDAVVWAQKYAKTFDIPIVYAVFQVSRPIDPRLLSRIGKAQLVDARWQPQFGGGAVVRTAKAVSTLPVENSAYRPRTPLQRRFAGGAKRGGHYGLRGSAGTWHNL